MTCIKCNSILDEHVNICPGCDAVSTECIHCGARNDIESRYCESCKGLLVAKVVEKKVKINISGLIKMIKKNKKLKIALVA